MTLTWLDFGTCRARLNGEPNLNERHMASTEDGEELNEEKDEFVDKADEDFVNSNNNNNSSSNKNNSATEIIKYELKWDSIINIYNNSNCRTYKETLYRDKKAIKKRNKSTTILEDGLILIFFF